MALHQDQGSTPVVNKQTDRQDELRNLIFPKPETIASGGPTWDYKPGGQAPYVSPSGSIVRKPAV